MLVVIFHSALLFFPILYSILLSSTFIFFLSSLSSSLFLFFSFSLTFWINNDAASKSNERIVQQRLTSSLHRLPLFLSDHLRLSSHLVNQPMTKTIDQTDDLIQTTTVFRRHSKGPVMFNGCSPSGDVIIIDNISPHKSYDLTGWYIERQTDCQPLLRYTFTDPYILPPLTTIELWSTTATPSPISTDEVEHDQSSEMTPQQKTEKMQIKLLTWNTARQWSMNRLFDRHGHSRARFSHQTLSAEEKAVDDDDE